MASPSGKTTPWFLRSSAAKNLARVSLRVWRRSVRKRGWHYKLVEELGGHLATRPLYETKLPNGFVMECDIRDYVPRHIYFHGVYEPLEACIFSRLINSGDVVIDAGANVGQYALLASSAVGADGSVHAFEPVPSNHARLTSNVRRNGLNNVSCHQAALWSAAGTLTMALDDSMVGNSGSFAVQANLTEGLRVAAVRLDDLVANGKLDRVSLIKIDVEGSEPAVLEGAMETLHRFGPTLLMEVNAEALARHGMTLEGLYHLLTDTLEYVVWRLAGTGEPPARLRSFEGIRQCNVLATRGGVPDALARPVRLREAQRWAVSGR